MKSEPSTYSIHDLKRDQVTCWEGVRNYQARNFMMQEMQPGDLVLFYHSNAEPPGVAGIAKITGAAYPDFTAWDKKSRYYDPKSSKEQPRWHMVDVEYVSTFDRFISLKMLKAAVDLKEMLVLRRGMRLSIQPVEATHFEIIRKLGRPRK